MHDMKKKPEKKGKGRKQPLSRVMRNSAVSLGMLSGLMGVSSSEKPDISVPQKLVENNALVKTEEWVTDEDVSKVLESEDIKGDFRIIRDEKYGNPKVVVRTETEEGYNVEFVLEITSNKHEKDVSEILEELGAAVSEEFIGRVELIEMAHRVSIAADQPGLVEDTIMLMVDEKPNPEESEQGVEYTIKLTPRISTEQKVLNAVHSTYLEKVLRYPNFMSDDADLLDDGSF